MFEFVENNSLKHINTKILFVGDTLFLNVRGKKFLRWVAVVQHRGLTQSCPRGTRCRRAACSRRWRRQSRRTPHRRYRRGPRARETTQTPSSEPTTTRQRKKKKKRKNKDESAKGIWRWVPLISWGLDDDDEKNGS